MKILPKHIFPIYEQVYKEIESPNNYIDGIIIKSDRNIPLPLGTKCIYSRNSINSKYTNIFLPFPIRYEGNTYDGKFTILTNCLSPIGDSSLLYKHNIIYIDKHMKAVDIDRDQILLNTTRGISTTIVIDYKYYSIYFLNKLLKLPYEYKSIPFSICGQSPNSYVAYTAQKTQIGITILNLNDCKPSFSNNFKGVGVKIKLYQSANKNIINIYKIFACLYTPNYKDLYFIDSIKMPQMRKNFDEEIRKIDKFIKIQKKFINEQQDKKIISKKENQCLKCTEPKYYTKSKNKNQHDAIITPTIDDTYHVIITK